MAATTQWTKRDIPSQAGKRIIITGGNSGIGWYTALELARAGAKVTIASRDLNKVEDAVLRIRNAVSGAKVVSAQLDLANPASVDAFVQSQLRKDKPLDILINNAGVMALPGRRTSVDGHELQFATNVLGPFRLTGGLLPALLRAPAPRVVTVASGTHKAGGPLPLSDLDSERGYSPIKAYANTKLANLLFTTELQRRAGTSLFALACHPGAAVTNLMTDTSRIIKLATFVIKPLIHDTSMAAEPTLMAATLPMPKPGGYYGPSGFMELRGHPGEAEPAAFARDTDAARLLFEQLEHITGTRYVF